MIHQKKQQHKYYNSGHANDTITTILYSRIFISFQLRPDDVLEHSYGS